MFFIRKPSISFIGANLFLYFLDRIDHLLAARTVGANIIAFALQLGRHQRLVHPQKRNFYFIKVLEITATDGVNYSIPTTICRC